MSNSPRVRQLPPRPKITLPVPGQYMGYPQTPMTYVGTPFGQTPIPMTPISGQPHVMYANKASAFMFTQFRGIKDWTKSGLSVGEKSAFWLYEKVSSWSKRWFTHIFLFLVVFIYSVVGALIFITVEGAHENRQRKDMEKDRDETLEIIRKLGDDSDVMNNPDLWTGRVTNQLKKYEFQLFEAFKDGSFESADGSKEPVWTFWNAVFYCGTIYTTIGICEKCLISTGILKRWNGQPLFAKLLHQSPEFHHDRLSDGGVASNRVFEKDSMNPEFERTVKTLGENVADSLPKEKTGGAGDDGIAETTFSSSTGEPRVRKRTKDKFVLRKSGYGSDSTDGDEKIAASIRRKKSPDFPKPKTSTGRSRPVFNDTDEDRNTSNNESRAKPIREKRHVSKPRYSTGTEDEASPKKVDPMAKKRGEDEKSDAIEARQKVREKRSISRHRTQCSDTDDDPRSMMKKSETFPQKSGPDKQTIKRSASEIKKQIIPLSDDSLIQDFAKAQEDYLRRERGILAPDSMEENYTCRSDAKALRRRKLGVLHSDPEEILRNREKEAEEYADKKKKSWFSWMPFFRKKHKVDDPSPDKSVAKCPAVEKVSFMDFLRALQEIVSEFRAFVAQNPRETASLKKLRNCCIGELILVIIYCGLGAFVFRFTEGAFETFYKCGVKRVKRDFLDHLWNYSHSMREDDWKSMARRKLMEFEEQLHNAHEAGVHSYSGQKSWTFLNAVSYCLTVITTIGYGHISPRTLAGRAITIVYAIFGIPIFLIILADFGKLFTRGIKFLWAFVRRLYYTGSCRKVRRTGPVQEVMKGVQLVYDFAKFRRPSQFNPEEVEEMQRQQIHTETVLNLDGNAPQPETPGTPAMSNFAIDDEFNLPISVAISILLGYIFVGATAYHMFEEWDFFESFYFVFISMSTIGFGDFVPKNPIFMMFSIVYLVFGLALTSMCINVVQTVLSDSFKQASQKISATIGFEVPLEEGEEGVQVQVEVAEDEEVVDAQETIKEERSRDEIAPKARHEDIDL